MNEIVPVLLRKTNLSITIEIELKRKYNHNNKEGLVVWIGAIVIHNEGHVNHMILVYSGYPDTYKDHKGVRGNNQD